MDKQKEMEFEFRMNHIKQVIKIDLVANVKQKKNHESKLIYSGLFDFARCIRKSGTLVKPNQISFAAFEGMEVQCALSEKLNYGGYRCITMRL